MAGDEQGAALWVRNIASGQELLIVLGLFVDITGFSLEKVGLTQAVARTKVIDGVGVFP